MPSGVPLARPTLSVVVPTHGRARLLARCLAGVEAQVPAADEIVVVHRAGDEETARFVRTWARADLARRRPVVVARPGVLGAISAGTAAALCDVVVYLDDDAVPRPGWLAEIARGFADPEVGAVGGRFVDHVGDRELRARRTRIVGRVTGYGRVIGRHDGDTSYAGDVEFLPGANFAVRRALARPDDRLLQASNGHCLGWEMDACLTVRALGYRVRFTPRAVVDHHTTSFRDPRTGSRVTGEDVFTSAANYTYVLRKYLPAWRRPAFLAYAYLAGSSTQPGPLRAAAELPRSPSRALAMASRIGATWRGRREGGRMYRRWAAGSAP